MYRGTAVRKDDLQEIEGISEKQRKREAREIARLEREKNAPHNGGYLVMLTITLALIYIVDELASNMNGVVQTYMILDLFHVPYMDVTNAQYSNAVGVMGMVQVPAMIIMLLTPFYKALADKFGRRLFLILNTLIMGIGLTICMISPHWIVFIMGLLIVQFVQTNDMQVMYIMETAPARHRAVLANLTKAVALMSVSLLGVFKSAFYSTSHPGSWRMIILIPAVLGLAIGLGCIPLIHETPVFIDKRLQYLNMTPAQRAREASKSKESAEKSKSGVGAAFQYIFSTPQMKIITFAGIVFTVATGITGHYTAILEAGHSSGAITEESINLFLILVPFINAAFTFLCGIISDALGRKKGCIIFSIIASIGVVVFVLGARFGWNILITSVGYGMFIGTLWSVTDTMCLVMPAESTPTELRASVMGTMGLIMAIGMAISTVLFIVAINIVNTANIGLFGIVLCVPFMLISCILLSKVRETKGTDLNSI